MNNFSENQDTFKKPNVVSGNSSTKNEKTYPNKNIMAYLIGDKHLNRINKENIAREILEIS